MNYLTNCVDSDAESIDLMVDAETQISYSELLENVTQEELDRVFPIYSEIPNLSLESDYSVSYYKSTFQGYKCVFVKHSAIEYIFTNYQ